MGKMDTAAMLMPVLHELNGNKTISNREKYPILNTEETNPEIWWDNLDYYGKVEVGSIALHYGKMTPNYRWKCLDIHKFQDLSNGQKRIVKFCLTKKDDNWWMFDLHSLLKL
jgi:hypothetical protein